MLFSRKLWSLPVAALILAGCADGDGPLGVNGGEATLQAQASLSCQVDIRAGELSCTELQPELAGGVSGAIIGGQGEHLLLESANASYNDTTEVFSAEVSVRNFLTQAIGTTDGLTVDSAGIRIFFLDEPLVTGGSGSVTIKNSDGTATFNAADQEYFEYAELLEPGHRSAVRSWEWDVPETVDGFSFYVGVSAAVADESTLDPASHAQWSQVTTANQHVCALDMGGKAYCWGNGSNGQLGNGSTDNRLFPTAVAGDYVFKNISAGVTHTCGVTTDDDGYCWGGGSSGRLGNDQTGDSTYIEPLPVAVEGGHKWVSISVGRLHTCGLTTDGDAYCWGGNGNLMLGNDTPGAKSVPTLVAGDLKYASVDAGYYNGCGVTTDGDAYCWGNGNSGRSGDGGEIRSHNLATPTLVVGGHKYQGIEAGSAYSCGLTTGGEIYCFGSNGSGQHGHGSVDPLSGPERPVTGGHTFVAFHNTFSHSCGITDQGELYCWGNSGNGRLGIGKLTANQHDPVRVHLDKPVTQVVAGHSQTCAITDDNQLYCWGNGAHGRLGSGSTDDVFTPAPISPVLN